MLDILSHLINNKVEQYILTTPKNRGKKKKRKEATPIQPKPSSYEKSMWRRREGEMKRG
jgi:hypothetical protein